MTQSKGQPLAELESISNPVGKSFLLEMLSAIADRPTRLSMVVGLSLAYDLIFEGWSTGFTQS